MTVAGWVFFGWGALFGGVVLDLAWRRVLRLTERVHAMELEDAIRAGSTGDKG